MLVLCELRTDAVKSLKMTLSTLVWTLGTLNLVECDATDLWWGVVCVYNNSSMAHLCEAFSVESLLGHLRALAQASNF